ncbi:MAG: methionyl-tRNA formyltransferase [Clostridia bacterium]|nr:methionyl-tRNA formyltransferase [Clostridia bacterium]NLS86085.1 methionyl-tRNA formyltransferase [Oscillospiraceae bacterium]
MRILFMGTPDIAAQSLKAIIDAGHEICGVYTREDKPVGRKQILTAPPVKTLALENNIPVFQPKTLRNNDEAENIKALAPQLIIVVAYGRILPTEILAIPPHGCINLHVSLLPKYRGSAPIQRAVINGENETGVTIMRLDEGVDTGDIITVAPVSIDENETSGQLFEKVSDIGAKTLVNAITLIENGTATYTKQDNASATTAPPLTKEEALFDFSADAKVLHDKIRGMNPWPMAFFMHDGKKIKAAKTLLSDKNGKAGEILSTKPLTVACESGALVLESVIPEGKSAMDGASWAAGRRFKTGDCI